MHTHSFPLAFFFLLLLRNCKSSMPTSNLFLKIDKSSVPTSNLFLKTDKRAHIKSLSQNRSRNVPVTFSPKTVGRMALTSQCHSAEKTENTSHAVVVMNTLLSEICCCCGKCLKCQTKILFSGTLRDLPCAVSDG